VTEQTHQNIDFALAYFSSDRKTGAITVVERINGKTKQTAIKLTPELDDPTKHKGIFIGLTVDKKVILLDPESKDLIFQSDFPVDAFAAHKYSD